MPLDFHKFADPAARAALAADNQGKFWEYHDKIMATNRLKKSSFKNAAKDLDLDIDTFMKDMESPAVRGRVQKDISDAKKAGVTGTPTVFINGRKLKKRNQQSFQTMIDAELQKVGHK